MNSLNILKNKIKTHRLRLYLTTDRISIINFFNFSAPYTKSNFYKYQICNFARNIPTKNMKSQLNQIKNIDSENSNQDDPDLKSLSNQNEINEQNSEKSQSSSDIDDRITYFYSLSKEYQLSPKQENWDEKLEVRELFSSIIENLKNLKDSKIFTLLIRALGYFKIKESLKIQEIFLRAISTSEKSNRSRIAMLIYYTLVKLEIKGDVFETISKKCLDILKEVDFTQFNKSNIIPFVWALSQLSNSDAHFKTQTDTFLKLKVEDFNEYEISILFRYYSKLFYYNYEVLELLIKSCLNFCPNLSLRYIIIITKCLSEMNIRNLNLLTGIEERWNELVILNKSYTTKNIEAQNVLTADIICQYLNNLVKLEFIEYENFVEYEELFLELASKNGIENKESIFSMLSTHCKFINKVRNDLENRENVNLVSERDNIDNLQDLKQLDSKIKAKKIRAWKEYKHMNEDFFEKILPYFDLYKKDMNFKTALNFMIIFKNMNIKKRKNLRSLLEYYVSCIDIVFQEIEETGVENLKEGKLKKLDYFVELGFKIFEAYTMRLLIIEKLKKYNFPYEKILENYSPKRTEKIKKGRRESDAKIGMGQDKNIKEQRVENMDGEEDSKIFKDVSGILDQKRDNKNQEVNEEETKEHNLQVGDNK
jgi:hypothetical protein